MSGLPDLHAWLDALRLIRETVKAASDLSKYLPQLFQKHSVLDPLAVGFSCVAITWLLVWSAIIFSHVDLPRPPPVTVHVAARPKLPPRRTRSTHPRQPAEALPVGPAILSGITITPDDFTVTTEYPLTVSFTFTVCCGKRVLIDVFPVLDDERPALWATPCQAIQSASSPEKADGRTVRRLVFKGDCSGMRLDKLHFRVIEWPTQNHAAQTQDLKIGY